MTTRMRPSLPSSSIWCGVARTAAVARLLSHVPSNSPSSGVRGAATASRLFSQLVGGQTYQERTVAGSAANRCICRLQRPPQQQQQSHQPQGLHPVVITSAAQPRWLSTASTEKVSQPSPHARHPRIVARTESGGHIVAFDRGQAKSAAAAGASAAPKLKPGFVRHRLGQLRTYQGAEKNVRHSPWRLNLVCQFAAGLPLQDALTQLEFCNKVKAPLVQKVLRRTANLADIRDGLQPSQLEVAECFATKGRPLKRIMYMGRGRTGRMEHQHAHVRVVLREIDFKLKIYQAPNLNQKKKWFLLQQRAERDGVRARVEREEVERMERLEKKQAAEAAAKKDKQ